MKIYYVWDAYCGWTYGFNQAAVPFLENHPELDIEMISGGLFCGENRKRMADFQAAKAINHQIEEHYGIQFSRAYEELFDQDNFTMDSMGPAIAFGILKNHLPKKQWAALSFDLQKLFFEQGQDLSQASTYAGLVKEYGLDASVLADIETGLMASVSVHPDFITASQMGIQSFPTMILEKEGNYYLLSNRVRNTNDLENAYQTILAKEK